MVDLDKINNLKKIQQKMRLEHEQIVASIKERFPDFYAWSQENKIDLFNLKKYSATIMAAFVLTIATQNYEEKKDQETPVMKVDPIDTTELQGLDYDQKALLVWERYGPIIEEKARIYNVDKKLVFATIMLESGGNNEAIRYEPSINDASYGLGQILYGTAVGIGYEGTPEGLYDPEVNIDLIARYHRRNLNVYGELSPQQLTTAYNAGSPYSYALPGHIDKFNMWYDKVDNLVKNNG